MRVTLFGKNVAAIEPLVTKFGFSLDQKDPDVVISYGGDGTLLAAERTYPGIAKLALRDSLVCKKCVNHDDATVLQALKDQKLARKSYPKLAVLSHPHVPNALNDVVIRNTLPMHAVRFRLFVNDDLTTSEPIIGDGIVIATAFGSSGYYHSITGETFTTGTAIAFNNPTVAQKPLYLGQDDTILVEIIRGPATLSADNDPIILQLGQGDVVKVKVGPTIAQIYETDTLRCPNCQVIRDKRL